ncbi:MAG: hypothetical protein IPJ81_03645 [Chitinophagaceae bacterium]|nr:hypothetical protein [Chitinophagaceae bacterium]
MPTQQTIPYNSGVFFITFTCYRWLSLIDITKGYNLVYKWFDILKSNGHYIIGFVIMPNHVHALIAFADTGKKINTIIGNGKRFMAYEIIERLKAQNENALLQQLAAAVEKTRRLANKQHEVWELSFNWKECHSNKIITQKLNYMHNNPCTGKWQLVPTPVDYLHSSAAFYITGENKYYPVTNYQELSDIAFIIKT